MKLSDYGKWTEVRIWPNRNAFVTQPYHVRWYRGHIKDRDLIPYYDMDTEVGIQHYDMEIY
jgi:hypothetical protein